MIGVWLRWCQVIKGFIEEDILASLEVKMRKVMNETKFSVKVEWDESTLAKSNVQFSVHKLVPGNWDPKKIREGGWREYVAQ